MSNFFSSILDPFEPIVQVSGTPATISTIVTPVNPAVTINRLSTGAQGTPGKLTTANNCFHCDTLELEWLNNDQNISCIPAGKYTCTVSFSPHMQKNLYHVLNVPNRVTIMIHNGNWAGEETRGYKSDVLGCILLGDESGTLSGQEAVEDSVDAVTRFMKIMNNAPFELTIINNF